MILPTIISVSESSLNAVPESYYEGARALGATHERSVFYAMLPAAKSGILAGIILGIGRASRASGRLWLTAPVIYPKEQRKRRNTPNEF